MRNRTRQPLSSTRLGIPRGGRVASSSLVFKVRGTGASSHGFRRGLRDGCGPGMPFEGRNRDAAVQERPGRRGMASASASQSISRSSSIRASTPQPGEGGDGLQGCVITGIGAAPGGAPRSRRSAAPTGNGGRGSASAAIRAGMDAGADRSGTGDWCRGRRWPDTSGLVNVERSG